MKNFNVLLTCCSIHVKEMIDCLKNNEDGVDIKVYVANSVAANLPPAELSDGNFVVPPISAPNYVEHSYPYARNMMFNHHAYSDIGVGNNGSR